MREIKFRGKREDSGKWVYGNLIIDNNKKNIDDTAFTYNLIYYISSQNTQNFTGDTVRVNKFTVGQYVDKKDTEGREIFEGDIVSNNRYRITDYYNSNSLHYDLLAEINRINKKAHLFTVVFSDGAFVAQRNAHCPLGRDILSLGGDRNLWEKGDYKIDNNFTIIGNIHDNPFDQIQSEKLGIRDLVKALRSSNCLENITYWKDVWLSRDELKEKI